MTQPFRDRTVTVYRSALWPELELRYVANEGHVLIRSDDIYDVLSNAPYRGGASKANRFVNWKVPLTYNCSDPASMMREEMHLWGYPPDMAIGLQTAAHITHSAFAEENGDEFKLLVCASAGTGNAARAGLVRETFSAYVPGTINIMIFVDGKMTHSAMVNAIISATEAKSAALDDLKVKDYAHDRVATGTTTDTVLVAVSQSDTYAPIHQYAGAATTIGNAIGRLAYEAVYEAVRTQGEPLL
ncbi:adenosylcobinamide amidohydrolase [Cohnella herbarum]|uniref:Adenosylcobinamide amidohydrolase n=1 Tax=Cohnella herbarum TaxID=2728023 RepID=A0A7Z2VFG0_9BACL|nr:adenosylcobinamide amidohydrolase [Cohnella herbarum]QJD82142.1 adenosylcobinamide amidohydrolase [Cohnella herbarum]